MKTFYSIIALLFALVCFPQQYSYRHYSIFDGLPQNQCIQIFQDSKGFVWVSTKAGVARFDGKKFEVVSGSENIKGYSIRFFEINNHVFFYSDNTIFVHDGLKMKVLAETKNEMLRKVYSDNTKGYIYILTTNHIYTLSANEIKSIPIKNSELMFNFVHIEGSDSFLTGGEKGLNLVNPDGESVKIWNNFTCNNIIELSGSYYFTAFSEQCKPNQNNGIFRWTKANKISQISLCENQYQNFTHLYSKDDVLFAVRNRNTWMKMSKNGEILDSDSLPKVIISDVLIDKSGHVWLATENGIYVVQSYAFRNFTEKSGMPPYIWSIVEDSSKCILFFSYNKSISKLENGEISSLDLSNTVLSFYEQLLPGAICTRSGSVLISTGYRILIYKDGKIKMINPAPENGPFYALSIIEEPVSENIYFGTTKGLYLCDKNINLVKHFELDGNTVLSLDFDKYGRLMAGTGKGVYLVKKQNLSQWNKNEKTVNNSALSIKKDFKGNIWYASKGNLRFYNYSNDISVSDKQYYFISEYKNKYIIAGGIEGVLFIDLHKFYNKKPRYSRFFDRFNGFIGVECAQNGTCVDSKGNVWIPTSESVVKFMPEKLTYDSSPPPASFYLFETSSSDLNFDTVAVCPEHSKSVYKIRYDQNNVRIGFHALEYSCPERVTYKYRLVGNSEIWNSTSETTITYTNLSPGDYRFELMAANENGIWSSHPIALNFRIVPAFWQTLWFKTTLIIIIAALLVFLVYYIMRRKRVREQKEQDAERRLINLQMSTINAQLDPHFIFNTITAIGSTVQERMSDEAYSYFVKMSQLLRTSLQESHSVIRPLSEEIQFVDNYLSLQQYRFGNRIHFQIEMDDAVNLKTKVPKMCIQIFVENAVKHGLENKPEGGTVSVSIQQKGKGLAIAIRDNGVGREAAAKYSVRSTGVGLRAFREFFTIMNRYNEQKAWFEITDLSDESGVATGTIVEVYIPVEYHYLNN